jgi:hypothetical protein
MRYSILEAFDVTKMGSNLVPITYAAVGHENEFLFFKGFGYMNITTLALGNMPF